MCFPNIIGRFQLFKEFTGNNIKIFNQIKYKENLFHLFIGKGIKVTLNGAFAIFEVIEDYFSHFLKSGYYILIIGKK